ncbi:MAG TPA: response regulator [Mycobacteriales bacterium]|nr:response regulator [Mycobacteriales bacterium]
MSTVLVVDDDAAVADFIERNLVAEGFDVVVARDGLGALRLIGTALPDLALVDVMMPTIDGIELVRQLRSSTATANLPVIMLTGTSLSSDKVRGLSAGADDYLVKPFDTLELIARVRSTLRRNADMRAVSPLTGLPGNHQINEEIERRTASDEGFAVCHVDLDNFKAFNDRYGWMRGDEVIELLATCLKLSAAETAPPPAFIGHVGGDDFVVVCTPDQVEPLCLGALERFDDGVLDLHEADDVERGYLAVVDRQGHERHYPITSVSIGVATTERRHYTDRRDVVAVANEMKAVAKGRSGSIVAIDRRANGEELQPT